jgi:hypothetical protein
MSEHTPGPWIAVGAWVEVEDDNIPDICTCEPSDIGQGHLARTYKEIMANARLIAAAPDLLEALQCALDHLEYCGYGDSWERECALTGEDPLDKKIEAAIAKAIGVTNAD